MNEHTYASMHMHIIINQIVLSSAHERAACFSLSIATASTSFEFFLTITTSSPQTIFLHCSFHKNTCTSYYIKFSQAVHTMVTNMKCACTA